MMKRFAVVAVIPLMMAGFAWGGVKGSLHDFSTSEWNGTGEICKPCHTPHNAKPNEVSGRLWNHDLTTASYTLNGHGTETETGTAADDLDPQSRLCLSCHDGTVALGAFAGNDSAKMTMGNINTYQGGKLNLGFDLSNDHPVGKHAIYTYGDELNSRYNPIATDATTGEFTGKVTNAAGKSVSLAKVGTRSVTLTDNTVVTRDNYVVGCYTCHGAHGNTGTTPKMLRMANTASDLCLTCHKK